MPKMSTHIYQPWRQFQPDTNQTPYGWIQWKGTDVCLDFHCKCGAHGHLDAEFAYYIKCGRCGQIYEMSAFVEAHPIETLPPNVCAPRVADVHDD